MIVARNSIPIKTLGLLAALTVLGGCERQATFESDGAAPDFEIVTDLHQTMELILEPAADVIWDSAGFIITIEGEEDLSPETQAGWDHVLHAAATLAEAGNLLMLPGRNAGPDWAEYSKGMTQASKEAMQAAQARDADALFEAGGRIYQVCRACHNQYWVKDSEAGAE